MATVAEAIDYSYARPGARTIVEHGYRIAFRYLGTSRDGRAIQRPELAELHGAGLHVAFVHQANQPTAELSVKRPLTGYAGGQEDARLGNLYADGLGVPVHVPIFTPVDVGFGFPDPSHYKLIGDFFRAHLDYSQRPVAAYGPYPVLEFLAGIRNGQGRAIEHFWQTAGASGAGSGSGGSIRTGDGSVRRLSRHACAFQHYGLVKIGQTDHNDVLTDDWGHWSWHPTQAGPGTIDPKELTMKAVYLPDEPEGQPKFWQPIDGLLRVAYDPAAADLTELQMTMAIGAVDPDAVTLQGPLAEWFKRRYHPVAAPVDLHWGAVKLMVETVERVKAALAEHDGQQVELDAQVIVDAIVAHLGGGPIVDARVTAEDVNAIAQAVSTAQVHILGAAAAAAAGALGTE